ncbi:hypothetical protein [Chryseobacterium sp. ERMR1:04]|uniref:hypothetical protein n=1 Tax=Chryseobacterium sp. ERMR1:04 TaxID=1705393 RepID=UPI0006C86611|nr:hypothetical protein [Chryseobacterium sp. ERMR1:04]KPH13371.1 hypothetical protein AMQ68_13085 [Chryseobacterium sp. ERMR1:04]
MQIEIYRATLKHDTGKINLSVVSLSGEQGAKEKIMTAEKCPRICHCQDKKNIKITTKQQRYETTRANE